MRFDCTNGLFHLVFANDSDRYYTPSLLRLNFRQYLYYELKRAGYTDIFFVDQALAISGCLDVLSDMNKKFLAFVFSIQVFSALKDHKEAMDLLEKLRKNNVAHHLILIYSPVTVDLIRSYFSDSDSIFMNPRLFPRILWDVSFQRLTFYERLDQIFGAECVSCLNLLLREDIDYMVKHLFLHRTITGTGTDKVDFQAVDDYVDFIWAWYHFRDFKQVVGAWLPDNQCRQLGVIERYLEDDAALEAVGQQIEKLKGWCEPGESLSAMAARRFKLDSEPPLVYEKYHWFHRLAVQGCETFGHICDEQLAVIGQRLEGACMEGDPEWKPFVNHCLGYMQTAIRVGDKDTYRRAVQAFCQDEGPKHRDMRQCQEEILSKSAIVFQNHKKIKQYAKKIEEQSHDLKAIVAQIEGSEIHDLRAVSQKERVNLLDQNMKDMEKLMTDLGRQTNALEKYIHRLELMADASDFNDINFETMV